MKSFTKVFSLAYVNTQNVLFIENVALAGIYLKTKHFVIYCSNTFHSYPVPATGSLRWKKFVKTNNF